ncbi:asparagine synthase-related protein [Prauserella shujinwangii]|uniref:asparagine synthase-related protein n=1 Tax=Prauserella shujinwangii TaxID=1453103 RepID=UPI0011B2383C|nr:asparagine synthase-related protein [Prauserella shujinwangii]
MTTAFGMSGIVPMPYDPNAGAHLGTGEAVPVWDDDSPRGRLHQGPVDDPAGDARAADRLLLTGWLDDGSLPHGLAKRRGSTLLAVQELLDEHGDRAVRRLRGDFVLAHLRGDDRELRLYRSVNALIPLFWRAGRDRFAWASDPAHLLPGGQPRLGDVNVELLPMIVAERGFPHDRSWFTDVHRLPAGECLTLAAGHEPRITRFDEFAPVEHLPRTVADAARGLRERLGRACDRMLAEQPAAVVSLSGGIDSAAVAGEVGRQPGKGAAVHYTMESFPGYEADRRAAERIAVDSGLSWVPYEMTKHTRPGGDYLHVTDNGGLPQTHVPTHGVSAAVEQAETNGATFVLSGLLADQLLAHDLQRGLFEIAGPRLLDPTVAGEPVWQGLRNAAGAAFDSGSVLRHLYRLATGDPTVALPSRDVIVHPVGFTPEAGQTVTAALRAAADRAGDSVRAAVRRFGGRRKLPRGITSLFLLAEAFNTPNLQAAWLNHCLPKHRFFTTPYADRDVIEYALALPSRHRVGFGHGMTVDKFALRLAYPGVGARRMQQARIDAISAVYVNQNFETCRALLGENSHLCRLGVLSRDFVAGLSRGRAHRNGEEIARLCIVEQWLEGLS